MNTSSSRFSSGLWIVVALIVVGIAAAGIYYYAIPRGNAVNDIDMERLLNANNEGIGYMEQFNYTEAIKSFRRASELSPEWLPGKINLAIALFNTDEPEKIQEALSIFSEVIASDPDNPHAHFSTGIIRYYQGKLDEAQKHFRKVTEQDPDDPNAWYFLGKTYPQDDPYVKTCYEKALQLNPYMNGALQGYERSLRILGEPGAEKILEKFKALARGEAFNTVDIRYTAMGKYAEVIGRVNSVNSDVGPLPQLQVWNNLNVKLATGTTWIGAAESKDKRLDVIKKRFGSVIIPLDFDNDNRTDLLLLSSVSRDGNIEDLLLHNRGNGKFVDVTKVVGLSGSRISCGCSIADFNNDGFSDLLITTITGCLLWENQASDNKNTNRSFRNVSQPTTLSSLSGFFLGSHFVDLDHDGDLDLLLCQYAKDFAEGQKCMADPAHATSGQLIVMTNLGAALPNKNGETQPLTPRFERKNDGDWIKFSKGAIVNVFPTDIDRDQDLDLVLLADNQQPTILFNDRLYQFHRESLPKDLVAPQRFNGGTSFDSLKTGRMDLWLNCAGIPPRLLLNESKLDEKDLGKWFKEGILKSPTLLQSQIVDIDMDGRFDVIGIDADLQPVLLHNDAKRLVYNPEFFSGLVENKRIQGIGTADLTGNGMPDLFWFSPEQGIQCLENQGNGNSALQITLTGQRDNGKKLRCNADAIGTLVTVHAGTLWTEMEWLSHRAGLGQTNIPLSIGIGKHKEADVVRLRWPDSIRQAEMSIPASMPMTIKQTNRVTGSCPLLFTWNGERYTFISDFLGGGALGEAGPDRTYRKPRPFESLKIDGKQLAEKNGVFSVKFAEPMDELTYLDQLQLLVIDHPKEFDFYPEEYFSVSNQQPSEDLLVFQKSKKLFPRSAKNHRGLDVTQKLADVDRDMVDQFAKSSWLGFAEEHIVELDFGPLSKELSEHENLFLFLHGWTDYPYPESSWAASQAGVAALAPMIERQNADKTWTMIRDDIGFPAGMPRMMTVDLSNKLSPGMLRLRIRTNMQIYWDQVFLAPLSHRIKKSDTVNKGETDNLRWHSLPVAEATLQTRGNVSEFSPDGRIPTLYDYDRLMRIPVTRISGNITRLGDVTPLLTHFDNQYVIFGPGDDLSVNFSSRHLSKLPENWHRSFVLQTAGYCKMAGLLTATGDTVGPLPFHGMSNFPYPATEYYPNSPAHQNYLRTYNTRRIGE